MADTITFPVIEGVNVTLDVADIRHIFPAGGLTFVETDAVTYRSPAPQELFEPAIVQAVAVGGTAAVLTATDGPPPPPPPDGDS